MKRALAPSLNPTGLGSAAAAVYAGIVMILNAAHHRAAIDPQVIIAALSAAAFLYARFKVTPTADPKDGNGAPLLRVADVAAAQAALPLLPRPPSPPPGAAGEKLGPAMTETPEPRGTR